MVYLNNYGPQRLPLPLVLAHVVYVAHTVYRPCNYMLWWRWPMLPTSLTVANGPHGLRWPTLATIRVDDGGGGGLLAG